MTLDEYQRAARRTIHPDLSDVDRLVDAAAGLAEEAGEVLGQVRKHVYQARPFDRDAFREELGDALWCIAAAAAAAGVTLDEVARGNLDKLARRWPQRHDPDPER
ncbi:MAG TPA: MazG nucleotide pyrophosphohydrolase domain-containing protein [Gemmatimonadaceae bacterium]|nr:MazG nucleotide pyrophosphohydrolase domain-containing protein [Gemmatimonadaceae bacterium]